MKPDRPLIVSILFLAGGLTLIFGYASGTAGLSAAFPVTNSTLHINVNTTGPMALGGIALLGVGVLLLVWATLSALARQLMLLGGSHSGPAKHISYSPEECAEDESAGAVGYVPRRTSFLGLESVPPAGSADLQEPQNHFS